MTTVKNTSPARTAGEMIGGQLGRADAYKSDRESQDGKYVK